jgi:hypothetical protein
MPLSMRMGLTLWRWALPMAVVGLGLAGLLLLGILHLTYHP